MKKFLALAALGLTLMLTWANGPARAVQPDEILADPGLESRARKISAELRCLVCQNQSIDDSDASLAKDLRLLVRDRLKSGDSDDQVKAYLVARYGNFVLLRPPFEWDTFALWLSPFALFGVGVAAVWASRRKDSFEAAPKPLSDEERQKLDALLGEKNS